MKPVVDSELGDALDVLDRALDRVAEITVAPFDSRDAATVIKRVESVGRRIDSIQAAVLGAVDEDMLYAADGHFSAKVMVRHVAKLSGPEAAGRANVTRALRELPELKAAYERGEIGTCQVRRIARVFGNKRVREQLVADKKRFIDLAKCSSFKQFDLAVTDWVRTVDEDGTADTLSACHRNRDMRIAQEFDLDWNLKGRCGSLQGAQIEEILAKFVQAELLAELEAAKAIHGEGVTKDMLDRTDAQRRWDAFYEMCLKAATNWGPGIRPSFVTNIVMDQATFERELFRLLGGDTLPADAWDPNFTCRTLNGRPINTAEATAAAVLDKFKRVVVNAAGVTIDMSRDSRFFTRNARLAVQIGSIDCGWVGCETPATDCQIDHITPWAEQADGTGGGCTCPENGAPLCGRHNRHKELGYTVYRDHDRNWHTCAPTAPKSNKRCALARANRGPIWAISTTARGLTSTWLAHPRRRTLLPVLEASITVRITTTFYDG